MEAQFDDELLQLKNALRQETFRFILVGHNRYSIYQDVANWLHNTFPERHFLELRFANKDYRQINDELVAFKKGVILIPDFGWLFREENEAMCVAFNQRRDAFARLDIALLCFIEPNEYVEVPKKVPDLWSLRSLELDFYRETLDAAGEFLDYEAKNSSLGGQTKEEKEAEIQRLLRQIKDIDSTNKSLLVSLYSQAATLLLELSLLEEALPYLEQSLLISQQIGDKNGEGTAFNNISHIYRVRGDYETALTYLEQSLRIRQQIGDKEGEGTALNNIGRIYHTRGDYETALTYLEQSLRIHQQIGDKDGEGTALNNIGQIYDARGDYETALTYLEQSLRIHQQIGDKEGEGTAFNNISLIYHTRGDYETALTYLEQSLLISQQIGDKDGEGTILNNISQIYDARGDYETALTYLEQSLLISQQIGNKNSQGTILNNIGHIYDARGDYETALTYLEQSLIIRQQIGDKSGEGTTLNNIGVIYWEQYRDIEKAVLLLRQANTILTRIGSPDAKVPEHHLNKIREEIGEEKFNQIVRSIQNESPS